MPSVKIISNFNEINSLNVVDPFDGKGKLVDRQGNYVAETYQGIKFQIVSKEETDRSCLQRVVRGFIGIILIVCSLGLGIFSKFVRDLFLEQKRNTYIAVPLQSSPALPAPLRHVPSAQTNTQSVLAPSLPKSKISAEEALSEQELQEGIVITEETVAKIQSCMEDIICGKEVEGVTFYDSQPSHLVFTLTNVSGLIFKIDKSATNSMRARYQEKIKAQTVLRTHQLGLLVNPHAKLFTVEVNGKKYEIFAEQRMDVDTAQGIQEYYFEKYADSLNEAVRQLTIFICKTGYSDVEGRNNPILNHYVDAKGNRKIVLLDLEDMKGKATGLLGSSDKTGLIGLVTSEQGKLVEEVAGQNGVTNSFAFLQAHGKRKKVLEENRKLKEYHIGKGIIKGDEPIEVDIASLGLDLEQEDTRFLGHEKGDVTLKLRDAVEVIVKEMNHLINANDAQSPLKEKRRFLLSLDNGALCNYDKLGLAIKGPTTAEERKAGWLYRIVQGLIAQGSIFKLEEIDGNGYWIQA